MDDSKILDIISENLKVSNKYIIIRDKNNNIIFPKDLDSIKEIERLINLKNIGRELYDEKTGNHYVRKTNIFYMDNSEYRFDLIENNNRLKKIEEKAKFDAATKLFNKSAILDILDQFILNCRHNIKSLAIVVCDIDKFKSINDKYGHLAGDLVLEEVSNKFKNYINDNCQIGRFGGDEFIFVFKNTTSSVIYEKIEKLKKEINNLKVSSNDMIIDNITMSFGIYAINDFSDIEYNSLNGIIEERRRMFYNADEALYKSKQDGRNMITLYEANDNDKSYIVSEIKDNIIDYSEIERLLKKAK